MTVKPKNVTEFLGGSYGYAFTSEEKEVIRKKLHKVAKECLQRYGVKKTTVDQMAAMVDISKGSFYNFYSSKEMIFYGLRRISNRCYESPDRTIRYGNQDRYKSSTVIILSRFSLLFMYTIFKNHEMELLVRKLPKEVITNHHMIDDRMVKEIVSRINIRENVSLEIVSAYLERLL